MRGRPPRQGSDAEVNMTPMLDIVFILLIFFIVTAVFIQERAIELTPPPPSNSQEESKPQPTVIVRIDQNSLIYVNNEPTAFGGVRAKIERERAKTPEVAVLIQAHPDSKSGLAVRLVDQARTAEIQQIALVLSDVET